MSDFYNKYPYTDFHELNLDWVIERVKKLTEDWAATLEEWNSTEEQWQQLYDYVHDYFDNLDVQQEINNKINAMIADGTFVTITTPVIEAKVASMMPATVASQIGDTVASQIGATVASQIGGVVAGQIDAAVVTPVDNWLTLHITQPTTPVVDTSLSITGAAADAAVTGDEIDYIKDTINRLNDFRCHNVMSDTWSTGKYFDNSQSLGTAAAFNASALYNVHPGDVIIYKNIISTGGNAAMILFIEDPVTHAITYDSINSVHSAGTHSGSFEVTGNITSVGFSYKTDVTPEILIFSKITTEQVTEDLSSQFTLPGIINAAGNYDSSTDPTVRETTPLIEVKYYSNILLYGFMGTAGELEVAYYNKNMVFMSGSQITISSQGFNMIDATIPSGAYYIRLSTYKGTLRFATETRKAILYCDVDTVAAYLAKYSFLDTSKLYKTWGAVGDSLTATYYDFYVSYVEDLTGLVADNLGIGGRCVTQYAGADAQPSMVESICGLNGVPQYSNHEFWTIFGGTNDSFKQIPIGSPDSIDPENFYGALNLIADELTSRPYHQTVAFITPPYHTGIGSAEMPNYVEAIKTVATKYNIPCLDLYHESGINAGNYTQYLRDGVHLTQEGANKIRPIIAKFIEQLGIYTITPTLPH